MKTTLKVVTLLILTIGHAWAEEKVIALPREFVRSTDTTAPVSAEAPAKTPLERAAAERSSAIRSPAQEPEQATAVSGLLDIVVAPIYIGPSTGNQSYLRLANPTSSSATYTIRVVGMPSGNVYGTATISVPARASPQYLYSEILTLASVTGLQGTDTGYSFYLKSTSTLSGFQHVIYNGTNKFFENVGLCTWDSTKNYNILGRFAVNVHTSRLVGYPSYIVLHNYASTKSNYFAGVYESKSGVSKGSLTFSADPNTSYEIPFSWFEQQVNWTPSSSEFHGNILIESQGTDFTTTNSVIGHIVKNDSLGAVLNMTQICAANSGSNVTSGGGGTTTGTVKQCSFDSDCTSSEICQDSGSTKGVCVAGCTSDFSCNFGSVCIKTNTTSRGTCAPGCLNDSSCGSGSVCQKTGSSSYGVCTGSCTSDSSCGSAKVCVKTSTSNGVCAPGCLSDFSCSFGSKCTKSSFSLYGICTGG